MRWTDLGCPLGKTRGPLGMHDDIVPGCEGEALEPLDCSLVVLHHDDAHPVTLSPRAQPPAGPGIPHGCYDSA